jgi:hypothetical protein
MFRSGCCCIDSTLTVTNGVIRSVGSYDEGTGTMLYFLGGISEVFGYLEYATSCGYGTRCIMQVGNNANVSVAGLIQQNYCSPKNGYTHLISETRNGVTKVLGNAAENGDVVSAGSSNISLYTAWDSAQVAQVLLPPDAPISAVPIFDRKSMNLTVCRRLQGIEVSYRSASIGPFEIAVCDVSGRSIAIVNNRSSIIGIHRSMLPAYKGVVCIRPRSSEGTESCLLSAPFISEGRRWE